MRVDGNSGVVYGALAGPPVSAGGADKGGVGPLQEGMVVPTDVRERRSALLEAASDTLRCALLPGEKAGSSGGTSGVARLVVGLLTGGGGVVSGSW